MTLTVGVDIGGTKVAAGVVDESGAILARSRRQTPAGDGDAIVAAIADSVAELRAAHAVGGIGIGAAGLVDAESGTVLFAPNVPGWRDEKLRDRVSAVVDLPVHVENDASAAAWAEVAYGAARGARHAVMVTLGTGIGGGLVTGGEPYRGRWGLGGELGHVKVVPDGRRCGCGQRGCWEQYASGNALVREARELAAEHREQAQLLLTMGEGSPEGITGPEVTTAAQQGDPVALQAFATVGRWVGYGMTNVSAVLDPEVYVIGGGLSEAGDLVLDPARVAYQSLLTATGHRPLADIVLAALGNDAGLVGAADLVRREALR